MSHAAQIIVNREAELTRAIGVGSGGFVRRLAAAKRRLKYHSRPGHGASKTRKSPGEAKDLARADIERLKYMIELEMAKSPNDQAQAQPPTATPERK